MRRLIVSIGSLLLLGLALFPPVTRSAEYPGGGEEAVTLMPIWAIGEWQKGQVQYVAELNVGMFAAGALAIIAVGALSWAAFTRSA